ncbi:MAG: fused response regulator/phosphatase [Gammaproteobacteria bacterium]|nr:fused response regulator/phosphatase [Gammaproteobacteria bacterium]
MNEKDIKILIADDTPVNLKIIQKFLEPKGFTVICAVDGQDAVDKYTVERPDIILMDVMMPIKDGYDATKEIKELAGTTWVPLIFLSAKASVEDQIFGINIGGDDYLTKPVDLTLLEAKLSAMLRIVDMQRKLNEATCRVKQFAAKAAEELALAKALMSRMGQRKENIFSDDIHLFEEPADSISGDMALTYQCEDPAKRYFMLADATGHGLTAAISLIPLSQTFFRLCGENQGVSEIVSSLNALLCSILPPDRFVAATVGLIDTDQKNIQIWNGSNPVPRLVSRKGGILHSFEQTSFCLGVIAGDEFSSKSETFNYETACELLAFSDGVIDAVNTDNETFSNQGIISALNSSLENNQLMFDKIKTDLNNFRDHENKIDDICMISICCD